MKPDLWGPKMWYSLHTITFYYPDNPTIEEKNNFFNFFYSLQYVIPCTKCRNHYKELLLKKPINVNSKTELSKWLIDIHNEVNVSLNKNTKTYDEVYNEFNNFNDKNKSNVYYYIIICVFIIGLVFLFVNYYLKKKTKIIYKYK